MRALVFLLLLCSNAIAQSPSVPSEIVSVSTVGRWHTESAKGSYRILTTRDGWEHVWSRVFVEWLPDPVDRESKQRPIYVSEVIPPIAQGTAVLVATARSVKSGEIVISVLATSNMEVGVKKERYVFRAGAPGVVEMLQPSGKR